MEAQLFNLFILNTGIEEEVRAQKEAASRGRR